MSVDPWNDQDDFESDDQINIKLNEEIRKLRAENAHRGELLNQYRAEKAEREASSDYAGSGSGSVDPNWLAMQDIKASEGAAGVSAMQALQNMDLSKYDNWDDVVAALNLALKGQRQ